MDNGSLYFARYDSPAGLLEITSNDSGVTSILFRESKSLDRETSPIIEECLQQLDEYFKGTLKTFTVPLAPSGTVFEESVWNKLLRIPYGQTCSYLDISRAVNNPKAIRAVGRANGANPIAIIVPCHRVIGSDGSLTGYAGGLWRKRWLLDHEARIAGTTLF